MATIRIDTHTRISGDEYQWTVERYKGVRKSGKFAGREEWEAQTYHQTLNDAARTLAQRRLRTADVEGVAAIMEAWDRITADIDAALATYQEPASAADSRPGHAGDDWR